MSTIVKIDIDKVTLKVSFTTVEKINGEMNETSFVHGTTRRGLQKQAQAQAADFIRLINLLIQLFEGLQPMDEALA